MNDVVFDSSLEDNTAKTPGEVASAYSDDTFEFALMVARSLRDGVASGYDKLDSEKRASLLNQFLQSLRDWSGQEFGDDVEAYAKWYDEHLSDWQTFSKPSADPRAYRI